MPPRVAVLVASYTLLAAVMPLMVMAFVLTVSVPAVALLVIA